MQNIYVSKRALVVDDSPTIRQIIRNELRKMGFPEGNVIESKDGMQAQKLLGGQRFDLIISDWTMPRLDGLGLLKWTRKQEFLSTIPFLMVTAETDEKNKNLAFESGADQYITKPFQSILLEKIIFHLLVGPIVFQDKRALVVDDSKTFRTIFRNNLKLAGFQVDHIRETSDGAEAINTLKENSFDLVVTDLNMPKMDGLEFTRTLRANPETRNTPVLMVTTESTREKVMEAIQAGINDYILKPFNAIDLQDKVRSIFNVNETALNAEST